MTDTPMAPDRERMIRMRRTHCEATRFETEDERPLHTWCPSQYPTQEMCQQCTVRRWWSEEPDTDEAVLLAEIDRLRARIAELEARPSRSEVLREVADTADQMGHSQAITRELRHLAEEDSRPAPCRVPDSPDCTCPAEPSLPLCGKTVAANGNVYAPCARHAGHSAAYCRDSAHNHYFLAAEIGSAHP